MAELWRIELFGGVRAIRAGVSTSLVGQLSGSVLGYLACHRDWPVRREELILQLWPNEEPEVARNRLNQLLFQLRRLLEPANVEKGSELETTRTTLRLLPDRFTTDVGDFQAALNRSAAAKDATEKIAQLQDARSLYKGDFMAGAHLEWVYATRQLWADQYVQASRDLSKLLRDQSRFEEAEEVATQSVRQDPLDERLHRDLIEIYLAGNRSGLALRQYRILEETLRTELDIAPSTQTRLLVDRLRTREQPTAVTSSTPNPAPAKSAEETTLFGREEDLRKIEAALQTHRLVALVGSGGIGKTTIASAICARRRANGSAWFVGLEDLSDPDAIFRRVRESIEGEAPKSSDPLNQIRILLEGFEDPVLVLDNLEQFGAASDDALRSLLDAVPNLKIVTTSRHRSDIPGQWEFVVEPLSVPKSYQASLSELARNPSIQLFVERARGVNPQFQLTKNRAESIAKLCERLEGIPLAIELAAAWANTLTVGQMLTRLGNRFNLLSIRGGGASDRRRTLRATLDYGFALLSPELQELFARLSVFRGGWTLEAAESICAENETERLATPMLLLELKERSFVSVEMPSSSLESLGLGSRFRMLETLREYSAEHLGPEERRELEKRRAGYTLEVAREASLGMKGPLQSEWITRLGVDYENLLDVLEFALNEEDDRFAISLCSLIWRFWYLSGRADQGRTLFVKVLGSRLGSDIQDAEWAEMEVGLACLNLSLNHIEDGRIVFARALAFGQSSGDQAIVTASLNGLGYCARESGKFDEALEHYSQALVISSELKDDYLHAAVAGNLAEIHAYQENWPEAIVSFRQAETLWSRLGTDFFLTVTALHLSHIMSRLGQIREAKLEAAKAMEIVERVGLDFLYTWSLAEVAEIACAEERYVDAAKLLVTSRTGDPSHPSSNRATPVNDFHRQSLERTENSLRNQGITGDKLPEESLSSAEAYALSAEILSTKK